MSITSSYCFDIKEPALRLSDEFSIISRLKNEQETIIDSQTIEYYFETVPQIHFEVTEMCNFKCMYCGYGENYIQPKLRPLNTSRFMCWDLAKTFIDRFIEIWKSQQAHRNIIVGFYGGEPLLNFKLIERIVEYLIANSPQYITFSWSITTNGFLLDKYLDFLIKHQFNIDISIDGDSNSDCFRLLHDGRPTFSYVIKNIDYLYNHQPAYFRDHVSVQSVINNRAHVIDVISFFYERYRIIPKIIELSTIGLCNKNLINEIFRDVKDDLEFSFWKNEHLFNTYGIESPVNDHLIKIIRTFSTNYYGDYSDFFLDNEGDAKENRTESATCPPFSTRIFLTASGFLFPCERVDFMHPLGSINKGVLDINLEDVSRMYSSLFTRLKKLCPNCLHQYNCSHCFMQDGYFDNDSIKCSDYQRITQADIYDKIDYLRSHSQYLPQLL